MQISLDPFLMTDLTEAINRYDANPKPGRINQLGLFKEIGIRTRTMSIDERSMNLKLIPEQDGYEGVAPYLNRITQSTRYIRLPQTKLYAELKAESIREAIRSFGQITQKTVAEFEAEILEGLHLSHAITHNYRAMGALKGIIMGGIDGKTPILDLFDFFEMTQKTVDFQLGNPATDVMGKCREVRRNIEDNLINDIMSGVRALVSREFFDKLLAHESVQKALSTYQANTVKPAETAGKEIALGGVIFEEFSETASASTGETIRLIEENEGHAFPEGTLRTFRKYNAPAIFIDTAGELGKPLYVKVERMKFDKGLEYLSENIGAPICLTPSVLVKVITTS